MSALSNVMLWAVRVNGRKEARAHEILDIKADATLDVAQAAFHKIARIAHPDLHRTTLSPEDLETVTTAYARAAAAYQEFRTQRTSTSRLKPLSRDASSTTVPPTSLSNAANQPNPRVATRATGAPAVSSTASGSTNAASSMSSKALIYYRKAELALRRGDLKGATLQLKMAIAADPQSTFLRTALAEVEAEVAKTP